MLRGVLVSWFVVFVVSWFLVSWFLGFKLQSFKFSKFQDVKHLSIFLKDIGSISQLPISCFMIDTDLVSRNSNNSLVDLRDFASPVFSKIGKAFQLHHFQIYKQDMFTHGPYFLDSF